MTFTLIDNGFMSENSKNCNDIIEKIYYNLQEKYKLVLLNEKIISYNEIKSWERGGAETYLTIFSVKVRCENQVLERRKFIAKALISNSITKKLPDWSRRRDLLEKNDIPVSKWHYAQNELIIEDYYPYDYKTTKILNSLFQIGKKIDELGFSCLNFLGDIRCDDFGNPFYVDFGFDLGDPSNIKQNNCTLTLKKIYNGKNVIADQA